MVSAAMNFLPIFFEELSFRVREPTRRIHSRRPNSIERVTLPPFAMAGASNRLMVSAAEPWGHFLYRPRPRSGHCIKIIHFTINPSTYSCAQYPESVQFCLYGCMILLLVEGDSRAFPERSPSVPPTGLLPYGTRTHAYAGFLERSPMCSPRQFWEICEKFLENRLTPPIGGVRYLHAKAT